MNVTKRKLSPAATAAVGVGVTVVVAAVGWFLLVSPQRSRAAELADEIVAVEAQVSEARRAEVALGDAKPIAVADLFRLTKAMPDDNDMAGVLLELSQVAQETGIEFEQIIPQATVAAAGYRAQPIQLVFTGQLLRALRLSLPAAEPRLGPARAAARERAAVRGRQAPVRRVRPKLPEHQGAPVRQRLPLRDRPGRRRAAGDDDRHDCDG